MCVGASSSNDRDDGNSGDGAEADEDFDDEGQDENDDIGSDYDDSDEDSTGSGSESEASDASGQTYTDIFNVMGSVKEKRYQDALGKVEEAMEANQTVPAQVDYDIGNPRDGNALRAEVWIDNKWKNVGTIEKRKIPKLTHAMRQGTITGCRLAAKPKYRLNVNKSGLNGLTIKLRISNHVRWLPDDPDYKYWQDLSHL